MPLFLLGLAALAYAVGGLFMKQSDGVTQLVPTAAFLVLFGAGALLQAVGMKDAQMGTAYVLVLGIEAILAVAISAAALNEPYSASKLAAMATIVGGIAWLRWS